MRFAMHREQKKSTKYIVIEAKRNNWRPTSERREVPDCLCHIPESKLTKVGDQVAISQYSPDYRMLSRYLEGEDPEQAEIDKTAKNIADKLLNEQGLMKEIKNGCGRMRRMGLSNPLAPTLIANQVFQIVRKQLSA